MYCEMEIPPLFRKGAEDAAGALASFDNVLIAAHVNLDGDALGSLAACGFLFGRLKKRFILFSSTGVPDYLKFLKLPAPICDNLDNLPFSPEAAVYLDCSEASRLGKQLAAHFGDWPSCNIDHHITQAGLGSVANFINPAAAATTQLIAYVAVAMGEELDCDLARAISLGLMTDTGGFSHANTTAEVFALCAVLTENGCDISEVREHLQYNWSIGKTHLWGCLLQHIQMEEGGLIAFCKVTRELLQHYHCKIEDLEGFVDQMRKIKNVKIAVLLREEATDVCKYSLRSHADVDVRKIATKLGGGGHKNASGGTIVLPLEDAANKLLFSVREYLKNFHDHLS